MVGRSCQAPAPSNTQEIHNAINGLFIHFDGIGYFLSYTSVCPTIAEVNQPRIVLVINDDVASLSITPYRPNLV
jgi:hypothetical protein